MGLVWGARAADAQPSAKAVGGSAWTHQDGHGAAAVSGGGGTEQQEHPPRFEDSFSANFHYYHPFHHQVFSPHHVASAHRSLSPLVVDSASAARLDDDSSSSHTTPITPYPPVPAAHGHFLQSSPGPESRRCSLAFQEEASSSIRAAFAFDADHQHSQPHLMLSGPPLSYRVGDDDMDDSVPVANPSRPQSWGRSSQSPFLSDQPPPRLAADTTNLVLRQGRASGSRFHPGPGNAQDSTHMALDDSQNGSTDSPCEAEPKSEQNTPRAEDIPASAARRPRGRPRLETNDETPAERRRTQVRLAQRGFRQRKDNHLRNLERKVRELESAHESMCTEFTQFYDYLRAERLLDAHPLAAERLQIIADRFFASVFAAKEASGGSGDSLSSDADNEPLSAHDSGDSTASSAGLSSQMQRSSTVGHHQAYLPGSASLTPPGSNFALSISYEAATQAIPASSSFPLYAPMESVSSNMSVPYYSMTPDTSTAGAFPYAGNEAFGRRLQRASVEASWRLITMANPPAERYAAVFGVRLFFESRETIIRRLRLFFGGAFHCEAALPPDEGLDHRMRIMYPGFEREFFNADGVEAYLGRLGISIPQNAAFVEAEVSLGDLEEAPTPWSPFVAGVNNLCVGSSDSMGSRASGTSPSATWPSNGPKAEEHMATSAAPGTDTIQHPMAPALGGSSASGGAGVGFSTMLAPTRNWPRASLAIDVNVLINEMALRSVCVGKVPGVRRVDVNRAVKLAAGLAAR